MKMGIRTPNIKKTVKARTTGKMKRAVKKSVNPLYGKKGMGYVNNPKKAVYNKVYNKTSVDVRPSSLTSGISSERTNKNNKDIPNAETIVQENSINECTSLSRDEINAKIKRLKESRKKSMIRCPIMYVLFFIFFMASLFTGSFFTWLITIITCLWGIGSGTNISIYKKEIKQLEDYLKQNPEL